MSVTVTFPELYAKFLEIYWAGDINNAFKLDYNLRDDHQHLIDRDLDRPENFYDFATARSMTFAGRVEKIYDATEYWRVYLAKVFIVDEGTNVLRFEFGGSIDYPKTVSVPCVPGGFYVFSGKIGSADFSWNHMNPGHIYAGYGFKHGVDFPCLDVTLDNATCSITTETAYTGRSFGLPGGEQFRQRNSTANSHQATRKAGGAWCFWEV